MRRISTGGSLAWAACGALVDAATELRHTGTSTYLDRALSRELRDAAFTSRSSSTSARDHAAGPELDADRSD